jgi:tRNA G46 methylase TrmB
MPFFRELLKHLETDGEIMFASNESFYMDEVEDYCENYWDLKALKKQSLHKDTISEDYKAITHFERKYLERGQTCYHYHYGFKDLSEKL